MQIAGFNFEKILIEKKKKPEGKVSVSSDINIKSIEEEKVNGMKENKILKINFEFKVIYKPNIAEILLQGFIPLITEKEEAKKILKDWKKKIIAEETRMFLFNFIFTKCNIKALQLEEEVNLPTHIPLPKIRPQNQDSKRNYAG